MKPEVFELTRQEQDSAVWQKLKTHLETRLEVMRKRNDGDLSEVETGRLRGQIAFAKELLGLDQDNRINRKADM